MDETARMLRAQRYLNEASVEPVRIHDVWALSPGLSFGRKGELSLERSSNVDRSAWELGYVDPNLFGSRWRLTAGYS